MVVMTVTVDSQNKDVGGGGGDERDLRDDGDTLISSKKEKRSDDVACDGIMPAAVKKTHLPKRN